MSAVAQQLPMAPFAAPRQLLRLFDIGESDLRALRDGQPIGPEDQEVLLKILYRLPQIGWDEIARWQRPDVPWSALCAEPDSARTDFFVVGGRVRSVTRRTLTPRQASLFEFDHYYQLDVDLDGGPGTAVIFARAVPAAWEGHTALHEPVQAVAMFVKLGAERSGQPVWLFAAPRVAWLPDRVQASLGIDVPQVLLGQWGMDIGLWDAVRDRDGLPLGADERECFYALLHAVGRADAAQLARHTQPAVLRQLLLQPQQERGALRQITGRLRRITRIVVEEPDVRHRFGIDAYYQLDVVVPVGDQPIEVRGAPGEQAGPVYRESFPCTCCTTELPAAWEPLVDAPHVNRPVLLHGVFYKLWAYHNPLVAAYDARQRQLSPMFVVGAPQTWDLSADSRPGPGLWLGLGFIGLLIVVGSAAWALHRSDRRRLEQLRQRRAAPDLPPIGPDT